MPKKHIAVSVVIPVFNEEARLEKTLRSVDSFLNQRPEGYEIVIVDDGSIDRTVAMVKSWQEVIPELRLLKHVKNRGKGWAVRTGMLASVGAHRVFMDADGSTSIEHLPELRRGLSEGADITISSRHMPGSRIVKQQPFARVVLGAAFRHFVSFLFGFNTRDTQNGFKVFTADAAQRVFARQSVSGWAFDVEILHIATRLGYAIREYPVTWIDDERSKVRVSSMPVMLFDLLKIRYRPLPPIRSSGSSPAFAEAKSQFIGKVGR